MFLVPTSRNRWKCFADGQRANPKMHIHSIVVIVLVQAQLLGYRVDAVLDEVSKALVLAWLSSS